MQRVRLLLVWLVVLTMGMTSLAHAQETPAGVPLTFASTVLEAAAGHGPGDADHIPADNDAGYPHHHGTCHGDHFATAVIADGDASHALVPANLDRVPSAGLPSATADPALRPPQA
jgi:hypothetical protein